jgi:raffinose/stachyose/melibiose transport system substrate-binding protein
MKKKIVIMLSMFFMLQMISFAGIFDFLKKDSKPKKKQAIRLVNGKIEIDKQLKDFAKLYEERTGQPVEIESLGGGVDISGTLKGYLVSGNMPDMFVFGGGGDFAVWKDYMLDLTKEDWTKNTDFAYKSNGKVYGFPYAVEGFGITYNADILKKAGIDPKTLVNYDAYKKAFKKIDSMKKELGLTAVCSVAAEAGQMYWSTGNHLFGYYLSGGLDRNNKKYINMLKKGEIDKKRMGEFADFMQLLFDYSDKNVLISGTYDDQLALWAQGKAAFITEGNWVDPSLPTYKATFDCGIAPFAFTKKDMTGVLSDCPSWWAVYNQGENIEAAKKFLEFIATSKEGQNALVLKSGMISPYKTTTVSPKTPLASSLKTYVDKGDTYAWDWTDMPEGIAKNSTALVFELYAKGEINKEKFVSLMTSEIKDYVTKK